MLDLARWIRFRWQIKSDIAVGDTRYGTTINILGLDYDRIHPYLSIPDPGTRNKFYGRTQFHYVAEQDLFVCPPGQELTLHKRAIRNLKYLSSRPKNV